MKILLFLLCSFSISFITTLPISAQDTVLTSKNNPNISLYTFLNKTVSIETSIILNEKNIGGLKKQNFEQESEISMLFETHKSPKKETKKNQADLEPNNLLSEKTSINRTTIIMLLVFFGGLLLFFGYIRHWKNRIKKEKN